MRKIDRLLTRLRGSILSRRLILVRIILIANGLGRRPPTKVVRRLWLIGGWIIRRVLVRCGLVLIVRLRRCRRSRLISLMVRFLFRRLLGVIALTVRLSGCHSV